MLFEIAYPYICAYTQTATTHSKECTLTPGASPRSKITVERIDGNTI